MTAPESGERPGSAERSPAEPEPSVARSADGGLSWNDAGDINGQPAAFESTGDDLYVALHDGAIKRSADGGQHWRFRSRP